MKYQPKGSMCAVCINKHLDCSYLAFELYPKIKVDNDITIVRCHEFNKENIMDESMKSDEQGLDEMTEALIKTGEANGNAASEEVAEVSSEENSAEATDKAPAESEGEDGVSEEVSSDSVPEEVVYLSLTFGEDVVALEVTEEFAVDFPTLCNEMKARPDSFESDGDLDPAVLMTLTRACG